LFPPSATRRTIDITAPGIYRVVLDSLSNQPGGFQTEDEIEILGILPDVDLGADVELCSPAVVDLIADVNGPGITYSWSRDGQALSETSNTLNVTAAGSYEAVISGEGCPDKSDDVIVTSILPEVENDTICSPGTATLEVQNPTGQYVWYGSATGGSPLATGPIYEPTVGAAGETFYVADESSFSGNIGPTATSGQNNDWGENGYDNGYWVEFDIATTFELTSVKVPYSAIWNPGMYVLGIEVRNTSGVVEATYTSNPSQVDGPGLIEFTFTGAEVDAAWGSTLRLAMETNITNVEGQTGWQQDGSFSFPYTTTSGAATITSVTANSSMSTSSYAYFYDWEISSGVDCDRRPVEVVVDATSGDCSNCDPVGTPCDDGDVATENDIEDGFCGCAGTPTMSCTDRQINIKAGTASDIVESCEVGVWEHFYDSDGDIIFSIRQGSNNHEYEVDLNVFPTIAETDGVSAGTFVMGRQWNVDVIGGAVDFPEPVSVRFYYNPTEMQDLIQTAANFRNLSPDSIDLSQVRWFKTTKGVDFDASMVTPEGIDPTQTFELFSVSAETVISPEVHFVQIDDINSFSGGSAFITGGVTVLSIDDELDALARNALNNAVVSPNPSISDFEIVLENIDAFDYELTITNSYGAVVNKFTPTVGRVSFGSDLASGVYYLNISNGIRMITKKLIKI